MSSSEINFKTFKKILDGQKFPLAFVDMHMLDENIQQILQRSGIIPIRIASKSIRCRYILDYILKSNKQFQGIMSFSGSEAVFLSANGFDDILVAYPVLHKKEIAAVCQEIKKGKYINLMTDTSEHIRLINEVGRECNVKIPISIDIDMSVDFPGLHFGVWRSSIHSVKNLKVLLEEIKKLEFVRLEGIMGYEAQIAGVTDNVPGKLLMNTIIRSLKKGSIGKIAKRRAEAVTMIREMDFELKIVNGGGTGSIESTIKEEVITEVTVGSGFFNSHLFDNYATFKHRPAAGFACVINRHPAEHIFTCAGGGYVASGSVEKLKLPMPFLPEGSQLMNNEGAGEVQTPIMYKGKENLNIGDPVFFRHSKAGELCERFNSLLLIRNNKIEMEVPTYRGEGKCFL